MYKRQVIDLYNQLMTSYLSNNSVQATQLVQSSVRRLLAYVAPIARGLSRLIETYAANVNANRANIQEYFGKLVFALAAYDLLEEQLRSGSMYVITASDLQQRLEALLTQHDHWRNQQSLQVVPHRRRRRQEVEVEVAVAAVAELGVEAEVQ